MQLPVCVAQDSRLNGKPLARQLENLFRLLFLEETECGIKKEQYANDDGLSTFLQYDFEKNSNFEHPGNRSPKFAEKGRQSCATT
jgi:hypothetical protein